MMPLSLTYSCQGGLRIDKHSNVDKGNSISDPGDWDRWEGAWMYRSSRQPMPLSPRSLVPVHVWAGIGDCQAVVENCTYAFVVNFTLTAKTNIEITDPYLTDNV